MSDAIVELDSVSKHFGAVRALHDVSLSIARGEVLGLVGDNGAGKSTLVNVLSGVIKPDSGHLVVRGEGVTFSSPRHAKENGIETVFQALSLIPTLDITANVYLHREIYGPGRLLAKLHRMDKARMRAELNAGLTRLGVDLPPLRSKVSGLSGGQKQMVAIARAVLSQSELVLLDEPAAALGVRQTETVLSFVERLKEHGIAVILISHNMEHIMRVSDRIAVLRLGRKVFETRKESTTSHDIVMHITGASQGVADETTRAVLRSHGTGDASAEWA